MDVGVTDWLPEVDLVPLQAPLAVQVVALVVLQLSVEVWPEFMLVGLALNVRVGGCTLKILP